MENPRTPQRIEEDEARNKNDCEKCTKDVNFDLCDENDFIRL